MRISDWSSDVCSSDLSHADDYSIHNDLNVKFGLGGMEHQLSIGADYSHTVFKSTDLAGLVSSIDLYDPTYDSINKPDLIFTVFDNSSRLQLPRWALFVPDRVQPIHAFPLLAGPPSSTTPPDL